MHYTLTWFELGMEALSGLGGIALGALVLKVYWWWEDRK
jgi:hypothetical protein